MEKKNIKLEALKKKLTELFQLDKADLDFGIYRILNQKRKDVEHFIESDLPEIVNEELSKYDSGKNVELQSELDNAIKNAKELGVDPESTDKVKELRIQLRESISKDDIEAEVYSSLTDFFSRYYDEGDFISQRRYKDGVYAIPYEGEEVKLHWANADQYYIKTTEDFANFSFYIDEAQTKRVSFQIAKAETEKDNNKEADSKKRRFSLASDAPVELVDGTLVIRFIYEVSSSKQESLNQHAEEQVKQLLPQEFSALFAKSPTEKDKNRTIFGKWLGHYTSKNTFDYFIHKDLRGFLSRELDFYIKNELLRIDDLDAFAEATNSRFVSKIKVFKHIAETVIAFLSQLENLQKKLWEKKKFVVQSQYLITIDLIEEKHYDDILKNSLQLKEWKNLGFIKEGDEVNLSYLKEHPSLQLNTEFYSNKYDFISAIGNLDSSINGVMVNGENYGALNLLNEHYKDKVSMFYMDPPYNTDATPILYKNNYKDSSWMSLMSDRIAMALPFLNNDKGVLSVAIDDTELANLSLLMTQINPTYALYKAIVQHYPGSGSGRSNISRTHEYNIFFLPRNKDLLRGNLKNEGVRERGFRRAGTGSNNYRSGRPNSFFAVVVDEINRKIIRIEEPPVDNYTIEDTEEGYKRVFPIGEDGSERVWTLSYEGALEALKDERLRVSDNLSIIRIYHDEANRNLVDSVWVNSKFNATTHGTNLLTDLFGNSGLFSYPKSVYTVQTAIDTATYNDPDAIIIDPFAGSGTTAHAIIKLNKLEEANNKKYVLVEMGSYFDLVTKPRIQKVIYSDNWQGGEPQDNGKTGTSQVVKYIKLESYEDALNNLQFIQQTDAQSSFLEADQALERNYRINYMLDFESQDSRSLLDVKQFENPFNYEMFIQDDSNRLVPKNVDLVDTFNYLIGLSVDHIEQKKGFVVVQGKQNDGTRTLIIWRNVNENPNDKLNEFLERSAYNPRDGEFDVIYVNGDNNVENLQTADDAWKVRLIEEEFHKRMFN